jgi:hypothetical protein
LTRHRLLKSFNEHGSPGWTINQLPGLRKAALGFCETSSQWVPWVVHEAVRRSLGGEHPVSMSCFRDHGIYVSTQTDDDFSYVISYAGEENIVIGTDYGHGDTSSELNAIPGSKRWRISIRR